MGRDLRFVAGNFYRITASQAITGIKLTESNLQHQCCLRLLHPTPAIYHSGVMRLLNRATRNLIAAATVAVFAATLQAQSSSSSSQTPSQSQTPASTQPAVSTNGTYIAIDPLAGGCFGWPCFWTHSCRAQLARGR
jgi:hypothetical protein